MVSPKYAYTKARMTFADPQFAEWETDEENILIMNFEGITIISTKTNDPPIYVFLRRPNPLGKGFILDLAWQGIHNRLYEYILRREILICYEVPQHPNSFIIWARYPILLYKPSENQYYYQEYKKVGEYRNIRCICKHSGQLYGLLDNHTKIYAVEFDIKPYNRNGMIIKNHPIMHINRKSDEIETSGSYKFRYINKENEFVIIDNCSANVIKFNILTMQPMVIKCDKLIDLMPNPNPNPNINNYLLRSRIRGYNSTTGDIIGYSDKYYSYNSNTNQWREINMIDYIPSDNFPFINSSIWVGATYGGYGGYGRYWLNYYDPQTNMLTKFWNTPHKLYVPDDDTVIAGLTIFNRIPLQILDDLALTVPRCHPIMCSLIQKFIRAHVIIPGQELEQS
jgi:hypothetical protein